MTERETTNLIDLSTEEEFNVTQAFVSVPCNGDSIALIPSPGTSGAGRLSFDNNPFDTVQKQVVFRQDDPFEIVEKEASLKARQLCEPKSADVKVANLLSLSEENDGVGSLYIDSHIFRSAESENIDNESPPVYISKESPHGLKIGSGETVGSCESSDSSKDSPTGIRTRKTRHQRNRLLKLSISNAVFSTPMSSRLVNDDDEIINLASDFLSIANDTEESNIDSESPVKLVEDDIRTEEPPETIYVERDYDADLELMKIPMLRQSPHKKVVEKNIIKNKPVVEEVKLIEINEKPSELSLPDLESIRQKLQSKRLECSNQKDISSLIMDLRALICKSDIVNENKKAEINGLLESLTSTLSVSTSTESTQHTPPTPITRQGTFDIDLPSGLDSPDYENDKTQQPCRIEDVPDLMFKSSATYDGESTEDKEHLNLPQIEPVEPENEDLNMPNVNQVIEQLQRFLEHQTISPENTCNGSSIGTNTPTFIVVMPTMTQNSVSEESQDFNSSYNLSMRRRSQSLSLHDKIKIVQLPIKTQPSELDLVDNFESPPTNTSMHDTDHFSFKTPARFTQRRNSFSSTTPLTPARFSRLNNSTVNKSGLRGFGSPLKSGPTSFNSDAIRAPKISRPNIGLVKPDPKKKVKTTEPVLRSNGPLKATLPFKNVAPNAKVNVAISRSDSSNTSLHIAAKAGHIIHTSTPMPSSRSNLLPTDSLSMKSFGKENNSHMRYSNIPTTPTGKTLPYPTNSTAHLRRRTISEFKPSPVKNRANSTAATAETNATKLRSNLIRPSNYSKTSVSSRYSNSAQLASKNKENKKP